MERGYWGTTVIVVLLLSTLVGASIDVDDPDPPSRDLAVTNFVTEPAPGPSIPASIPFFTENRNQFGTWPARFYAHGEPWSVALGDGWVAYDLHGEHRMPSDGGGVVRVTFHGADQVIPEAMDNLPQKNHYLFGQDPTGWVTDVANHRSVVYWNLWDGIDLRYGFQEGTFKYEFIVAPDSDPANIVMDYEGMDSLEVCKETGDLLVRYLDVTLRDHAPVTYQVFGERKVDVASEFWVQGSDRVTFKLGHYDNQRELVIDPGMLFSTFLGESGDDVGKDVAVDEDGHVYVVGHTSSSKFPVTPGAYDASIGSTEGFLSKFSANGSTLEYSTFIGGLEDDGATGVTVDDDGSVFIVGTTMSSDFPITSGAYNTTYSGVGDAFALKLNATGSSLDFSTYIGGDLREEATCLGIDANGTLYVAGFTYSKDFPQISGSFRVTSNRSEVFVVKIKDDGSDLEYSCVLGGNWTDRANDMFVDDDGYAYITGSTGSPWYPTTLPCLPTTIGSTRGVHDVFVTKLNPTGTSLVYSSFIGETGDERGWGIDVDGDGNAYVVGSTDSGFFPSFPLIPYEYPTRSSQDSFVLKLAPQGHLIIQSRVFNIRYGDRAQAVSVDEEGCTYITGYVDGRANFETTPNAFQPQNSSEEREAYVLKFDAEGERILYASFLGGNEDDQGNSLARDSDDLIYVTGHTLSTQGFPTTPGAYDNTSDASSVGTPVGDAFLCKLDMSVPYLVNDTSNRTATTGESFTFNLSVGDNVGIAGVGLQYWFGSVANSTNISLNLTWGDEQNGSWTGIIDIPSDSLEGLYYRVWANDSNELNCTIREYWVKVVDNDLPDLVNLTPGSGGTGNEINLSVKVVDNIEVSIVDALYTLGGLIGLDPDGLSLTVSPIGLGGGVYNFTITLPLYSTNPIEYRFWANDTSGNWRMSDVFELEVVDDDAPILKVDPPPDEGIAGKELDLRVHVRDNIAMAGVMFTWWFEGADDSTRVTLPLEELSVDGAGNGHYDIAFLIPLDIDDPSLPPIRSFFRATDMSGNNVTSRVFWMDVRDNDPPWILEDISPSNTTTGDPFDFKVRVRDNVDTASVWVHYWFGAGRTSVLSLGRGEEGVWNGTITIPHSWTALHYYFGAKDGSGNANWSAQVDHLVMDNDPPEVVSDTTDSTATTGDPLTFVVQVVDNLFVAHVRVLYWMEGGDQLRLPLVGKGLTGGRNGTYMATVNAPSNKSGPLTYVIEATDAMENLILTDERYIEVLDNDRPWFGDDLSDDEAWRGETFALDTEVWDNVDVRKLTCEWWYGSGEHENETMSMTNSLAIVVPLDQRDSLRYRFSVRDGAGNWNSSETHRRTVKNMPPRITGLEVWNVHEDKQDVLDLREFIDDRDDGTWSFELDSSNGNVTLDGYSLSCLEEKWVPNYMIAVSVSDGWDTARHEITVHVVVVNDPPRLIEVIHNGKPFDILVETASFKKGSRTLMTVHAIDEEGEVPTFSWRRHGVEVAKGSDLRGGELPIGNYDLTLLISDGIDTSSYIVSVSVAEEQQTSLSKLLLLMFLSLMVAALTILIVRRSVQARGS